MSKKIALGLLALAFAGWGLTLAGVASAQASLAGKGYKDFRSFASGGTLAQLYQTVQIAAAFSALQAMPAANVTTSSSSSAVQIAAAFSALQAMPAANVTTSSSSSDNGGMAPGSIQNFATVIAKSGGLQPYLMGTAYSYGWWIVSFQFFMIVLGAAVVLKAPKKRFGLSALFAVLTASTFYFTCLVANCAVDVITHTGKGKLVLPYSKYNSLYGKGAREALVLLAGLLIMNIANALLTLVLPEVEEVPAAPIKVDETPVPSKEAEASSV